MSVSKRNLSLVALAAVALVLATAAIGHAEIAHDGRHDGLHFDGHDFHHRLHGNTAVAPLYRPYDYPYTYYAPAPNYYWYCPSYGAYYPSVDSCPDDEWVAVPTG
jgi:hypothetical protein